jgi:hypothetical protein
MAIIESDDPFTKFNIYLVENEIRECFDKLISSKSKKRFKTFENRIDTKTAKRISMQTIYMAGVFISLYLEIYTKLRSEYSSNFSEEELLKVPRFVLDPISGQYFYRTKI